MKNIELKVGNISLKLDCKDPDQILNLAKKLNEKVEFYKKETGISDIKSLLVASLYLMEETESLSRELQKLKSDFYDKFNFEQKRSVKNYGSILTQIQNLTEELDSK
jgi:cell division protein ZapA (FtsZ GTPase activity inhibitor)